MYSSTKPIQRQNAEAQAKSETPSTIAIAPHQRLTGQRGFPLPHTTTSNNSPLLIQPKFTIGAPGDRYEQEADRVADRIMRMPKPGVRSKPGLASMSGPSCGDREATAGHTPVVTHTMASEIASLLGRGKPLPAPERAFFEQRLGHDFNKVRVHLDSKASALANSLKAKSFTVGNEITFGPGQYRPGTPEGRKLLAHELAHVVQQGGAEPKHGGETFQQNRARAPAPQVQRMGLPLRCPPRLNPIVMADQNRAMGMLASAIARTLKYIHGMPSAKVQAALSTHYGTTSRFLAVNINAMLQGLLFAIIVNIWRYICTPQGTPVICGHPNKYGWTLWCLPGMPVFLCMTKYFSMSDVDRATGLLHELAHKFLCKLDLGYRGDPSYPSSFLKAMMNAENLSQYVKDVQ